MNKLDYLNLFLGIAIVGAFCDTFVRMKVLVGAGGARGYCVVANER